MKPIEERNAKDFEKLDNETICGPPWSNTINGSHGSLLLVLEDTNIASKGLVAPERFSAYRGLQNQLLFKTKERKWLRKEKKRAYITFCQAIRNIPDGNLQYTKLKRWDQRFNL